MANQTKTASVIALVLIMAAAASAQMTATYYSKTCPSAVATIRAGVISAVGQEARMGASLLRLHFHDCFVNGCDGSVLLDGGEKSDRANVNSIRGFEVIDSIKATLESACPGVVSCADILAVAARESVVALGGPSWNVLMGRRDSASPGTVGENLVSPSANLSVIISTFGKKGFSVNEMVALYGAHTIGQAQCSKFRDRIYNEANIDPAFAAAAQANCPSVGGDTNLSPLHTISPTKFDNGWFQDLVAKKGLLHSDQQLYSGGVTDNQVSAFAKNQLTFKSAFANGMLKMSNLSPLLGSKGQIRANCRKPN